MKKNFFAKIVMLFITVCPIETVLGQNQTAQITSGNTITGTGGSVSYSVGQIAYTTNSGVNGSTAQGVQQPYEISTVLGIEETAIQLEMLAYPNPTNDYLILSSNTKELLELFYELIDSNGKLIETREIDDSTETIQMDNLPSANYFIKINIKGRVIKVFKIIKN